MVTGSRADWGLLKPVADAIAKDASLQLQLIATGSHLEAQYGNSIEHIRADGHEPDVEIPLKLQTDSPASITHAMARALHGMADAYEQLQPQLILLLGDRYEILAAAQAALIAKIPVAHIAGGDVTEGAFDDAIRHAISKLSHIHFATNQAAQKRLLQMGENPAHVHLTGSPALDQIRDMELLSQAQLQQSLGMSLNKPLLLVTYHPVTLAKQTGANELEALLSALDHFSDKVSYVITGSNADTHGQSINQRLQQYTEQHDNCGFFMHLGQQRYYSLMQLADAVVGNSSSGLYEAPSFNTPTVNIGDRQKGREMADSVINCDNSTDAIVTAIKQALDRGKQAAINPYGDGHAVEKIMAVLKKPIKAADLIRKPFFEISS
ncbi:MAG: UDP-N-acetylglucosamine 2-epimerase [Chromatiales bacterium]|jgi:UDP-hydrolysing UDP-N-acetyl-D-glucosamine 2-epimerase